MQMKLDGDQWCATEDDFVNLQESPAGFGKTPADAAEALALELEGMCRCTSTNSGGDCDYCLRAVGVREDYIEIAHAGD